MSLLMDKKPEAIIVNIPSNSDDDFPLTQIKVYSCYGKKNLVLTLGVDTTTYALFPGHYVHTVTILKKKQIS